MVREQNPEIAEPSNVSYELINRSKVENDKIGEQFVYDLLAKKYTDENQLYHTSLDFPQPPYDIEYIENGEKKYVEVKPTYGAKFIFICLVEN